MRSRRVPVALAVVAACSFAVAARADAHAEFVDPPAVVAADADVPVTLFVEQERGTTTHTVGVTVALPAGWTGVSCAATPTWTCALATDGGRAVIRFAKDTGAAAAEDEHFTFTVHSGTTAGSVAFPTVQTYGNGEVVRWIEAEGSELPAPTLQAGAGTVAPTTAAPTAAPTAATTTAGASASTAPATTVTTTAAATTTAASTIAAPTTAGPVVSTSPVGSTTVAGAAAPTTEAPSSGGDTNSGTIVFVAVVAVVAGAAFVGYRLARRPKGPAA